VAIISIVSTLSYPSWVDYQSTLALRSEIMTLRANVMRARLAAIYRNAEVVIQLRPDGYSIFVDDGAGGGIRNDRIRQDNEEELVNNTIDKGLVLSDNFPADRFRFCGRVGNRAGTITVVNPEGDEIKLIINITGRARVEKG